MKSRIAIAATMFSIVLIVLFAVPNGRADDFYKGKTIHFVVGAPLYPSGGAELELIAKAIMVQPPEVSHASKNYWLSSNFL